MQKKTFSQIWIFVIFSIFIVIACLFGDFRVKANDEMPLYSVEQVDDVSSEIEDQIVILYKQPKANNIKDLELSTGEISEATSLSKTIDVVTISEGKDEEAIIEKIEENNNVAYAFQNEALQMNALPDDPELSGNDYYYTNSQIDETWDITNPNAEEVVVAVIDSGVKDIAEDFGERVYDVIDKYSEDDPQTDLAGHGTKVASNIVTIANNGIGLAGSSGLSNVKVLPYRIGGDYSEDENLDLAKAYVAMEDIVENHDEVKVVNMSFGLNVAKKDLEKKENTIKAMQSRMDMMYEAGIICVASAGNSKTNSYNFPACCEHVISVASVDANNERSSFSTYNEYVDVAAVGRNVPVATMDGRYQISSGTSFSAPIVSGACAFLLSTTGKSTDEVVEALCQTANHAESGRDDETGYGVIQLKDALEYLAGDIDFSVQVEQQERYCVGDMVTILAESEGALSYVFKINEELVENTGEQVQFEITKSGLQTVEVTGILPCGARQTKVIHFKAIQKGDLNGDTQIDREDANLAKAAAMKNPRLILTEEGYQAGDLNGDGKITVNEARRIKRGVSDDDPAE